MWPRPHKGVPAPAARPTADAALAAPPVLASVPASLDPFLLNSDAHDASEVKKVLRWLNEHSDQIAATLGAALILGVGVAVDIPEAELHRIGKFVLSLLVGHFTVASVTPALHTPLISVTNAISGIIVVGGMLQLDGPLLSARVACALAAVFLSSVNIVGGFAVTQRMLEMFREDVRQVSIRR